MTWDELKQKEIEGKVNLVFELLADYKVRLIALELKLEEHMSEYIRHKGL